MDKLKAEDILLANGKIYVSMEMYKELQESLHTVQGVAESFLQKLTAIEVANEYRRSMKIIKMSKK